MALDVTSFATEAERNAAQDAQLYAIMHNQPAPYTNMPAWLPIMGQAAPVSNNLGVAPTGTEVSATGSQLFTNPEYAKAFDVMQAKDDAYNSPYEAMWRDWKAQATSTPYGFSYYGGGADGKGTVGAEGGAAIDRVFFPDADLYDRRTRESGIKSRCRMDSKCRAIRGRSAASGCL